MKGSSVISVVDNEESILTSVGSLIRSIGLTARLFYSAENFIRSKSFTETACLIADVQMPNMSGLELQAFMNRIGGNTPIIFITGFAEPAIRQRALAGGAICVLDKPFQGEALINCIDDALASRRLKGTI